MTVASEITRLQGAKSDIRQAIIDKGVDVGANLTLDGYAACITAIPSGPKVGYIDFLIVGGGGNGGPGYGMGSGGGAGGFIEKYNYAISNRDTDIFEVVVGAVANDSCFLGCIACKGGQGGYINSGGGYVRGENGGSGGGAPRYCNLSWAGTGIAGQGNNGGSDGGGGGGAGSAGGNGMTGAGGSGKCSCISGRCQWYSAGGGGQPTSSSSHGAGGTGGGGAGGGDATTYGSGGGGGAGYYGVPTGKGCQGVVILRYKTDGSCGICNTSTGGCKYTCGDYTIHCFTNTSEVEQFVPVYK